MSLTRRRFLAFSGVAGAALLAARGLLPGHEAQAAETFPLSLDDDAWRARLTPDAYAVLRQEATERPYSSPLNGEKRTGSFHCAGCDNALYRSDTKFDSGTGWPSFWQAVDGAVGTKTDYVLVYPRTEVHCARCGGHLGHIFNDGPAPTGKRHCINGVALAFQAA